MRPPAKIFIDLHNAPADSYEVADRFVHANSPTLIASYVVFYRNFLNRWSRERLSLIKDIKAAAVSVGRDYKIDSHRLVALPAVAAARILIQVDDLNPEKEELWQEISQALHNPKVEVREIVLQNLITATYPNDDTVKRFTIDQRVLTALDALIEDAQHTDKLLSPLCLCTQLLLNTRSLYLARGAKQKTKDINKRLQTIANLRSKFPHFEYVARLKDQHEKIFPRANPANPLSLPPQLSEPFFGLNGFSDSFRPYLENLALIDARHVFRIWNTAQDKDPITLNSTMSPEEARRTLPKALSILKNFGLRSLLPSPSNVPVLNLPAADHAFQDFLQNHLDQLLTHPEREGFDLSPFKPSQEELDLASCVPFAQYTDKAFMSRTVWDEDIRRREFTRKWLSAGISGVATLGLSLLGVKLYELLPRAFGSILQEKSPPITEKEKERIIESAIEENKEIDEREGAWMDEQEKELGPVHLLDPPDLKKIPK